MSTVSVGVSTHSTTHTITYVTSKLLMTMKEIIREIGLNPANFTNSWQTTERAVSTWLKSEDLVGMTLEVYDPAKSDELVTRWDLKVIYGFSGDGSFWTDTQAIRYAIQKAGKAPSQCTYDVILQTKPGRPDVAGWGPCSFRHTDGFKRFAIGSALGAGTLATEAHYWKKS